MSLLTGVTLAGLAMSAVVSVIAVVVFCQMARRDPDICGVRGASWRWMSP